MAQAVAETKPTVTETPKAVEKPKQVEAKPVETKQTETPKAANTAAPVQTSLKMSVRAATHEMSYTDSNPAAQKEPQNQAVKTEAKTSGSTTSVTHQED